MDRLGIEVAIVSVSSPGVRFGAGEDASDAAALARHVNEVAGELVRDHPGRFGAFASLPAPDVDASLAEMAYALDELALDGVVLLTNVNGTYLGDAALDPMLDELHHRHATVFVHPTSPPCWDCVSLGRPRPMLEFPFDTTRAVTNLVFSGAFDRYDGIRWILPHAGGTLPFLSSRIAGMSTLAGGRPDNVTEALRRAWYDLAGSTSAPHLAALDLVAEPGHVLYGSDWPFTPEPMVASLLRGLDEGRIATLTGNARALFPRFA
jgi:predicted TIM-barrel fold metal-dependent hydrolase